MTRPPSKGRKPPTKRRAGKKSYVRRCDDIWRKLVKDRAYGLCERCLLERPTQAHHVIPRRCYRLRFDVRNGCALCMFCHGHAHSNQAAFLEWFRAYRPEDHAYISDPENTKPIHRGLGDYQDLLEELKAA